MIISRLKLVDGTLTLTHSLIELFLYRFVSSLAASSHSGDLNKALKDLVNVITDQENEQSDLNENEIE